MGPWIDEEGLEQGVLACFKVVYGLVENMTFSPSPSPVPGLLIQQDSGMGRQPIVLIRFQVHSQQQEHFLHQKNPDTLTRTLGIEIINGSH